MNSHNVIPTFIWDDSVMMGLLIVWKLTDVFGWGRGW